MIRSSCNHVQVSRVQNPLSPLYQLYHAISLFLSWLARHSIRTKTHHSSVISTYIPIVWRFLFPSNGELILNKPGFLSPAMQLQPCPRVVASDSSGESCEKSCTKRSSSASLSLTLWQTVILRPFQVPHLEVATISLSIAILEVQHRADGLYLSFLSIIFYPLCFHMDNAW